MDTSLQHQYGILEVRLSICVVNVHLEDFQVFLLHLHVPITSLLHFIIFIQAFLPLLQNANVLLLTISTPERPEEIMKNQ